MVCFCQEDASRRHICCESSPHQTQKQKALDSPYKSGSLVSCLFAACGHNPPLHTEYWTHLSLGRSQYPPTQTTVSQVVWRWLMTSVQLKDRPGTPLCRRMTATPCHLQPAESGCGLARVRFWKTLGPSQTSKDNHGTHSARLD
ncbi:hypothetical protein VFPPC_18688 [Pochonia chlamydosporia 170]|uniref:Uncharacterized protein n=1 Tax=Pochonia chlamydosporia 170 TaxID=1380566 RepID=A0A219ATS5_METCM|nr:hypothetical protein VFPPC_18688 [Pochonia chlamydosporia 170]OWT43585.1 hypothetical protein VFPPC_18688 [Pochonia chlamydosporia 170]